MTVLLPPSVFSGAIADAINPLCGLQSLLFLFFLPSGRLGLRMSPFLGNLNLLPHPVLSW